jgi:hypothetical protein
VLKRTLHAEKGLIQARYFCLHYRTLSNGRFAHF